VISIEAGGGRWGRGYCFFSGASPEETVRMYRRGRGGLLVSSHSKDSLVGGEEEH